MAGVYVKLRMILEAAVVCFVAYFVFFLARDVIYTSCAYATMSVCVCL